MNLFERIVYVGLSMFCAFVVALLFYYGIYSIITDGTAKEILISTAFGIVLLYTSIFAYKGLE